MPIEDDPRFQRSKTAILDAARQLLVAEGPASVTHALVSQKARVGRATVYRHWPRSADLLAEAMEAVPLPFFATTATPTRSWFREELLALARQLDHDDVRAVATTLANSALWDEGIDARRDAFATELAQRVRVALSEARSSGEVDLARDLSAAAAMLIGPLYYRSTIERTTIDDQLVDDVIASVGEWR